MDETKPNNSNATLELPLLITRGLLVFPNMTESIEASRAYSVAAIDNARGETNSLLLVACQKDPSKSDISDVNSDIFLTGTLCRIVNFVNASNVYRIRVIARNGSRSAMSALKKAPTLRLAPSLMMS
jgi:ATP-dependent Lon protease